MKRKAPPGSRPAKIRKLQLSVQTFVEKAEGGGSQNSSQVSEEHSGFGGRGKSRKELRKEKRLSKKLRRKEYYERRSGSAQQPAQPAEHGPPRDKAPPTPPVHRAEARGQDRKRPAGGKKPGTEAKKKISKEEARKKALLEANEKEEKEIKKLEKSLRMNKRKNKSSLPQAFTQDGLDYILGVLEPGGSASGLYDEEKEEEDTAEKIWGLSHHPLQEDLKEGSEEEKEDGLEESEEEDEDNSPEEQSEDDGVDQESEEEYEEDDPSKETLKHESDGGKEEEAAVNKKNSTDAGNKYVPPQLRQSSEAVDAKKREELERLKKSVKGLMNRLSEPNMASISGQLEELYMTNSRKDMNDTLTSVLLNACITPAKMPDRLMMEHVLLVAILHNTVGIEVGAHILETVVQQFHDLHQDIGESKECDNLLTIIGHLYNFHVIDARLLFDILKLLVSTFTERNIELILMLLKNVGFSLRKDDALALKELISEAQNKANAMDKEFQDHTRVRFMLETMLALKNNDMRKIPGYDPEPVEKLRKLQRTLVHSSASGSDTRLRVSLENLLEAEKVGRWWIVGSSWSGAPMINESSGKSEQSLGKVSAKIMELARKQRMNTDIRRNIFCVIMTSEDYLDAFEKLLKLGLKDHQEREIVHVLIDCCLQEKRYNPFYAFLASKFCEYDRRFLMTFQFSMWDKFRDLGNLSTATFSNLIQLLSHLIKKKSLPLSIFKVIEFSELDKTKVTFLRQILSRLLVDAEADDLAVIFGKISDNPKLGMLREGLKLFISHFLLKNIQKSAEEAELLRQKADIALKALQAKDKLRL
ncbi:nucleolar MIF4G domain-containing protein 1 [Rana temporaria]|uniref:nucleolar MIF4G domain-containing protein 1 n=1 Tax=Rana temporaria TaxID=8407 RepID=UPI001AAD541C|nr:nucleolar MIF4G domain-containing protein 1 [Rana temporaria]